MEEVKKYLERALAAVQLAANKMDRLTIQKKNPVVDEDTKNVVAAIVRSANMILGNSHG